MKKFFTAVMFTVIILSLFGCKKNIVSTDPLPEREPSESTRSVFIYMSGADAEKDYGLASQTLGELVKLEYDDSVNVIVQTGGSTVWHEDGISSDKLDRFEVHDGALHKVDSVDDDNMGTSKTLMDFLKWGNEKYPARSRILVIWGQGGGCVGGVAYDARHDYDSLTPGEVGYALSRTGVDYELVGFDACMMSTLETASAIAPYASCMVASEEYQPCGWDYENWLGYVMNNPTAPASNIGIKICETFYNKCVDLGQEDMVSVAVTDLSKVSALAQAFDGLAGQLTVVSDSLEKYRDYATGVKNTHLLGGKNEDEGYSNMVDLNDFSVNTAPCADYNHDLISEEISEAVIYSASGNLEKHTCGMGIFYPVRQNADELKKYFDIVPSSNYTEFLRSICAKTELDDQQDNYKASWAWSDYMNERGYFKYSAKIEGNCYELDITGNMDIVSDVSLNLYKCDKNGMYLYMGKGCGVDVDREAGIYKDNGNMLCFKINGNIVPAYTIDKGEGYILYSIPAYINGNQGNIRVAKITRNGKTHFKTYGFWKGIKVAYGISDRTISKIGMFDKIEPFSYDYASGEYYTLKPFKAMLMKVKEASVPNGEYKLEYRVEDIYGDVIKADPADVTVSGGSTVKH